MSFWTPMPRQLSPDEHLVMTRQRHYIVLLWRLLPPALVLFVPLAAIVVALITNSNTAAVIPLAVRILAIVFLPVLLWAGLNVFDWTNDALHITNKRIIRIVRNYFWDERQMTASLAQIQNVAVHVPDPLAYVLNYGTVVIETAAQEGRIDFAYTPHPREVQRLIFQLRGVPLPPEERQPAPPRIPTLRDLIAMVLPIAPRYGPDGSITWHKHWFILLLEISVPVMLCALVVIGAAMLQSWLVLLLLVPCGLLLAFQWANWINDIYILTDSRIVDIYRIPMIREERREALLEQIQNVSFTVPNLLCRILDMGQVFIETAGKAENFTFDTIHHPAQAYSAVVQRLEAVRSGRRLADEQRRRQEIEQIVDEVLRKHYPQQPSVP